MTIGENAGERPAVLAEAPLRQARNSAAFWAATARARRHEVIRRPGFLAVAGDERAGLRILIQEADPTADELAEIIELAGHATGPVDVEDRFSSIELSRLGMRSWQMPVMLRQPGPVAEPAMDVARSRGVGRAVMLGSLALLVDLPVKLTASRLGRPLYESLGFATGTPSTWWSSR